MPSSLPDKDSNLGPSGQQHSGPKFILRMESGIVVDTSAAENNLLGVISQVFDSEQLARAESAHSQGRDGQGGLPWQGEAPYAGRADERLGKRAFVREGLP